MSDFTGVSRKVIAGLGLASAIAWLSPFDTAFAAATFGIPAFRAVAICAMAIAGMVIGRTIGLGIEFRGTARPIAFTLAVTVAVAVGCAFVDWLFLPILPSEYTRLMTVPVAARTVAFMARAFNENIMYRLFLGSVMVYLIGLRWKTPAGQPAAGAYWAGFTLAQTLNIWLNVTSRHPITAPTLTHDLLRYVAPGVVWAWLYWRRGFQSNELACTSVHLFLQPMLQVLI
jgi:hypothetical protein